MDDFEFVETFVPTLDNNMFIVAVGAGIVVGGALIYLYLQKKGVTNIPEAFKTALTPEVDEPVQLPIDENW